MGLGRLAPRRRVAATAATAAVVLAGLGATGCGRSAPSRSSSLGIPGALIREARPIGRGGRFHPPSTGPVIGPCLRALGPRLGVHVEVFAANRVVLVAAGIGTRPPRTLSEGRIAGARCYGALVTLDPTGVVLVRPGVKLTLADLFRSWGQPLSSVRVASFASPAGKRVAVFVGGRRWPGPARDVPLSRHSEIVLELGPHVPPHSSYTFPPGA